MGIDFSTAGLIPASSSGLRQTQRNTRKSKSAAYCGPVIVSRGIEGKTSENQPAIHQYVRSSRCFPESTGTCCRRANILLNAFRAEQ